MENKACILKNTVVTLNMYLNLVFTKNVSKLEDIESSRNVSVITSSVKKNHFIQAHGQKYIFISISLEYINT